MRTLVTSALPYANGPIHIGHLAGCYLPADIYTRYKRLKGEEVIHICGTDEHGVLISLEAEKQNITPQKLVDKYYKNIKDSFEKFGIEFDNFSRTSLKIHHKTAQDFFLNIYKKGYLEAKETDELYCQKCNRFLPERYVEGICPFCGFESARGDQCEKCGRWLEPEMLKEPRCKICKQTPVIKRTKHWFFKLPMLQDRLKEWLDTKKEWKDNVRAFTDSWLKEGLESRPITRDIPWGISLPLPEVKDKVLYVWFEAPIGYISATKQWSEQRWKEFWCSSDTRLVHFIGKDNIVFHAIVWPAMLMAHGDFILPSEIPANEFLNIEGRKISTSRNWAIWLSDYLETFEPDPLRYILTSNAPEKGDVDFTWDDFLTRNNDELSDILGNFVNRTLTFIQRYLGSTIPYHKRWRAKDEEMLKKVKETGQEVGELIEHFEFKKAIKSVMALAKEGNKFFDYERPWENQKTRELTISTCTSIIANLGILLEPFLPFTAKSIRDMICMERKQWDEIGKFTANEGGELKDIRILFKKVSKEQMQVEKAKLGIGSAPEIEHKKEIEIKDFEKLELVVAEIKDVQEIKGKENLLNIRLKIEGEEREVVAGFKKYYKKEELIGKKVIYLTNLKPKTIGGIKSRGMILAADINGKPVLLVPERDVAVGTKIR